MKSKAILVHGPIRDTARATASREVGAAVDFYGVVRETEGTEKIAGLFYEAYEPMAVREFERIFAELEARHPIENALVIHRLGEVPVGEASLLVRVAARHRGQALAFCSALIDRMKEDVPIWKSPLRSLKSPPAQ